MISYSDIEKFIKNALNVRVNSDVTKPLNQVISEAITNARDNINTTTNNARDVLYAHITACKDAVVGHITWIKDVLAAQTATEAHNTRTYLEGKINARGTVKSVQRGYFSPVSLPLNINFATINADKSMIFINGSSSTTGTLYKRIVTSNMMQITAAHGYNYPDAKASGDWEIIEYY